VLSMTERRGLQRIVADMWCEGAMRECEIEQEKSVMRTERRGEGASFALVSLLTVLKTWVCGEAFGSLDP